MPWPDHLLSLEEWDALPEDNTHHIELVEGTLRVCPRPISPHQRAIGKLFRQLDEQLPADLVALLEVEMVVRPGRPATVRAPDLVVVPTSIADTDPTRFRAEDVLLAVEVISPGSVQADRLDKPFEYSRAGIPSYWTLDIDRRAVLTAFGLIAGEYKLIVETSSRVVFTEPAPVTIDVAGLLPHRA